MEMEQPATAAAPALLDIHETARDAGCFTFVTEVWTVDDSHPELTRDIRRLAEPRYVPLLCRRIYLSPAGTEVGETYHVVGKYIEHPEEEYHEANVRLAYVPRGFPFPPDKIQPLRTLWAPWPKGSVEYLNNSPPARVEIGPWLLDQMRSLRKLMDGSIRIRDDKSGRTTVEHLDCTPDKLAEILRAGEDLDLKLVEDARKEARYRMRHNWRQMKSAIDAGRWAPEPPDSPRPFVDLGDTKKE